MQQRKTTNPHNITNATSSSKPGFTIIEVVLVLAVAGLIMAMVFVALPSLQRSQKDKQRKQSVNTALSAIDEFRARNSGLVPCSKLNSCGPHDRDTIDFIRRYVDEEYDQSGVDRCGQVMRDPDGLCYYVQINNQARNMTPGSTWTYGNAPVTGGRRYMCIANYASCSDEEGKFVAESTQNSTAIIMVLNDPDIDRSSPLMRSSVSWYCIDNTD